MIETESHKIKELERAIGEKAGQLFYGPGLAFDSTLYLKRKSAVDPLESVVSSRTGRAHASAYGCSSPATGKLLRAILATEQNLASEVLGVKGANRWRDSGPAKSRWEPERVREPCNQAVFGMKLTQKIDCFQGDAMAPDESKFETPLIGSFRETTVRAHFGRKLQKIFPLPANSSEPENVRVLLRMIQSKLDKPPVPGDG